MATAAPDIENYEVENDFNIFLTCCKKRNCRRDVSKIQTSLHKCGVVVNLFYVHAEFNSHIFQKTAARAQCVLLIECDHISKIGDLTHCLKNPLLERKTIVARKSSNSKFEHFQGITLRKLSDFDECVKAVMDKIAKTIYGSTTKLNDYEDLGGIGTKRLNLYETFKNQNDESMSETSLKRVPDPDEVFGDKDKKYVVNTLQEDRFIHAETLEPIDANKGPLILESFTKPRVKDEDYYIKPIASAFNRAKEEELQELSKFVMSSLIPKLRTEGSFVDLINLLKIDDSRIQSKVTETLKLLQIEGDIKCANVEHLFTGIHIALQILEQRPANHSCISKMVPVVMNAISILYLHTVIHFDEDFVIEKLRRERFTQYFREMDVRNQSVEYQDFMTSLSTVIDSLESKIGKKSCLQMGNWEEAFCDERNCEKLRKDIVKMSYIEQYACVFCIVNQLCLKKIPLNLKIACLLKDLLKSLIARALKKKTESALYPILVLATQGVVYLFVNMFHEDGFSELIEILKLYLDNAKILQIRRSTLLAEIEQLLFHKNTEVAETVVRMFRQNGCTEFSLRNRGIPHIEKLLSTSSLKILQNGLDFLTSKPEWHSLNGTLCGAFNVELNVLLPSQKCLSDGCMNDYKRRADKSVTKRKITSLEILLHLQETSCHSNVVRLIAYQFRPLPLFYITESFPGQNFQSFLLTKRKNQDWLSCLELETFVVEVVHALEYLHSKNVIHCDLTTSSFSFKMDRRIVLTELKIARKIDGENNFIYASDWLCENVPTRWISPESVLEDKYDRKTDIWMLGPLIYEIFTHGCHPYTELYNIDTEKVLEWVVFRELKLRKWPCIPVGVQEIILSCIETDPEKRTNLDYILDRLNDQLASEKSPKRSRLSSSFSEDEWYPDLDLRQQRKSEPEKGIPRFFVSLKQSKDTPRKTYFNMRASQLRGTPNKIVIKEENLLSSDQPNITTLGSCLFVEERVKENYVEQVLPQISQKLGSNMCIYSWPPDKRILSEEQNGLNRSLVYRCHKGIRLLDFADKRACGDPCTSVKYLDIVLEMVNFVATIHNENWIHRDICCRSLYITDQFKVFSPRIGRMCRMNSDNCVLGPLYQDRINWMPIEVLQGYNCKQKGVCQYSKDSDIYMLACAIYEFFKMLEIRTKDPKASELESVPFATLSVTELLDNICSGEIPPQPRHCPVWLYELLVLCWNRESSRRPSINYIKDKMKQRKTVENIYEDPEDLCSNESCSIAPSQSSDDYPNSTNSDERHLSSDEYHTFRQVETPPVLPPPRNGGRQRENMDENPIYVSDSINNGESFQVSDFIRPKSSGEIIAEIVAEDQKPCEYVQPSIDSVYLRKPKHSQTTNSVDGTKRSKPLQQKRTMNKMRIEKKSFKESLSSKSNESDSGAYLNTKPPLIGESDSRFKGKQGPCKRMESRIICVNSDSDSSCRSKSECVSRPKNKFECINSDSDSSCRSKSECVSRPKNKFECINSDSDSSCRSKSECVSRPKSKFGCINSDSDSSCRSKSECVSRPKSKFGCINSNSSDVSDNVQLSSMQLSYEDAISNLYYQSSNDDYLSPMFKDNNQDTIISNKHCRDTASEDEYNNRDAIISNEHCRDTANEDEYNNQSSNDDYLTPTFEDNNQDTIISNEHCRDTAREDEYNNQDAIISNEHCSDTASEDEYNNQDAIISNKHCSDTVSEDTNNSLANDDSLSHVNSGFVYSGNQSFQRVSSMNANTNTNDNKPTYGEVWV